MIENPPESGPDLFTVTNRRGGHQFQVRADETVLDSALRHGRVVPYSCRSGTCGTCKATLVAGRVDYGHYAPQALSEAEKQRGQVLLCQAIPLEDIVVDVEEIAAAGAINIKILPCRVTRCERLAPDVMVLTLRLPQGQELAYLPGQYIDILLRDGRRRSFSLASAPDREADLQIHVRHVPDGRFTSHVFDGLKERDLLRFQGPFGTFFLRADSDRPLVMLAGGTGFAPIKAILERAFDEGLQRPVHLFWGARAARDLYMNTLVESWVRQYPNFRYTPVLSEPLPSDDWTGETGWVHDSVIHHYPDLGAYDVYASGPPPMIDAARAAFPDHGLQAGHLFYDSFEFAADSLNVAS
jgi:CDP-4-dehydro-6-deoxyglucose reductase